ncbi:hypothetical protein EP7_001026 [Isosphaeraceae bacterium EP7]
MRQVYKRVAIAGLVALGLVGLPWIAWISLNHAPAFYRAAEAVPPAQRKAEVEDFVARSLQLRNDIVNEPTWEAAFTDQQVNAWLAEELMRTFADQLPPEVHEPRVSFEADRVILAFQLDRGPLRSLISVTARVKVSEDNVLALTLIRIRAGVVPVPSEEILARATAHAKMRGVDLTWSHDQGLPVATLRFKPDDDREDIVLERLWIKPGEIRLAGRSNHGKEAFAPVLPKRQVLQSKFPSRKVNRQARPESPDDEPSTARSSTTPTS